MEEVGYRQHTCLIFIYIIRWQAQVQIIQFLKNFYEVFPEYKNVDVRAACYLLEHCLMRHDRPILLEKALLANGYHTTVRHFAAEICEV